MDRFKEFIKAEKAKKEGKKTRETQSFSPQNRASHSRYVCIQLYFFEFLYHQILSERILVNACQNCEHFSYFCFRSKSPVLRSGGSTGRSVSPFSQKVSLVNPNSLLAPGAIDTSKSSNILENPPKTSKWDVPPSDITTGMS